MSRVLLAKVCDALAGGPDRQSCPREIPRRTDGGSGQIRAAAAAVARIHGAGSASERHRYMYGCYREGAPGGHAASTRVWLDMHSSIGRPRSRRLFLTRSTDRVVRAPCSVVRALVLRRALLWASGAPRAGKSYTTWAPSKESPCKSIFRYRYFQSIQNRESAAIEMRFISASYRLIQFPHHFPLGPPPHRHFRSKSPTTFSLET